MGQSIETNVESIGDLGQSIGDLKKNTESSIETLNNTIQAEISKLVRKQDSDDTKIVDLEQQIQNLINNFTPDQISNLRTLIIDDIQKDIDSIRQYVQIPANSLTESSNKLLRSTFSNNVSGFILILIFAIIVYLIISRKK